MSVSNIFGSKIEADKSEILATIEMKLDDIKAYHMKTVDYLDTKIPAIIPNKHSSFDEQAYYDLVKGLLLKAPDKYSHESQFTKHFSSRNLEGENLLQLQNCWNAIQYALYQYLSTNKIWTGYK